MASGNHQLHSAKSKRRQLVESMLQLKFSNDNIGLELGITITDPRDKAFRECWVTSLPKDATHQKVEKTCKAFCKQNSLRMQSFSVAEPYTRHTWQHEQMFIFAVECTKNTQRLIYEFGKI